MNDVANPTPRIVVGVDGSDQSKQALRWAGHLAHQYGARLEAISTWEFPVAYGWSAVPTDWNPQADTQKLLDETVDVVFGGERPKGMITRAIEGGAAARLLECSDGALMLVVGSRGHGGFAGLLLGSVSSSVAEHATCPVLVVHGDAPSALFD